MIMLPLIKIVGLTAAGSVVGELFERVFLKKETANAVVQSVNWTRVIIAALVVGAAFFALRKFFSK